MRVFSEVIERLALVALLLFAGCSEHRAPEESEPVSHDFLLSDPWSTPLTLAEALHPLVFDAPYYRAQYGDLAGMSEAQLSNHWWTIGIDQGRRASAAFDVKVYVRESPDLANGYGTGNYRGLTSHYVRWGIAEGRDTADDFHVREYLEIYADLSAAFGTHFEAAALHWRNTGQPVEGRAGRIIYAPTVFNLSAYRAYNKELNHLSDIELVHHWRAQGINQGRRASHAFHVGFYRSEHTDLQAYATNLSLIYHFYRHGRHEGRASARDFRVREYLERYPDLSAAYTTYYGAACEHWENNGRPYEHRLGVWQPMLHAQGRLLVDDSGAPTLLRGASFGNNVWAEDPTKPPLLHHDERDYERLASWGMNSVRFYLNHRLFDTRAQPNRITPNPEGFRWLDQNIAWARKHGIYLVLNMHFPHGGYQSGGNGDALWEDPLNQELFIELWLEIAKRYRDEPVIAGFDLLNEPCPKHAASEWHDLARRTVQTLRTIDTNHLIFLERESCVNHDWSQTNWFALDNEPNLVYEFHFYTPMDYTHQGAYWLQWGEGGEWPREMVHSGGAEWRGWTQLPPPPKVDVGSSPWKQYDSIRYSFDAEITAAAAENPPRVSIVRPTLMAERIGGTVYFDDLSVREYDPSGLFVREVARDDLEFLSGFSFWQEQPGGMHGVAEGNAHRGSNSLKITGGLGDSGLANEVHFFRPRLGHTYSVHVWMKGENIADDATGCRPYPNFPSVMQCPRALARLEYWRSPGNFWTRGKAQLVATLQGAEGVPGILDWGEQKNVPIYLGEFGLMYHCFERGRGGANWVNDMFDILLQENVNFSYHAYHEPSLPIFRSNPYEKLPAPEDEITALTDVFKARLLGLP